MTTDKPAWQMTLAELAAIPLPPEPPELTPEEGAALIRELNVKCRPVTMEEYAFLAHQPAIRDMAAVERTLGHLREGLRATPEDPFLKGVRDAFAWAYGHQPLGPVSGEPAEEKPPRWVDLREEAAVAADALAGALDDPPQLPKDYIVGVEHTTLWLHCGTDDPPAGPLQQPR